MGIFNIQPETIIIRNLLTNSRYFNKVFPYLKSYHFQDNILRQIFKVIKSYVKDYDPMFLKIENVLLYITNNPSKCGNYSQEEIIKGIKKVINVKDNISYDVLINETEKYIKKMQLSRAILDSVDVIEKEQNFDKVLEKVESAIGIKIEKSYPIEIEESIDERKEIYSKMLKSDFKFFIEELDKKIYSGILPKTLNIVAGASHSGKSAFLVWLAGNYKLQGKNIIYYTLEMSDNEIARRVESVMFGYDVNNISYYMDEIKGFYKSNKDKLGKLYIQEYPAGVLTADNIASQLKEMENDIGFKPDVIFIDYLGLMHTYRVDLRHGSYGYYKAISEDLQRLAKLFNVPVVTGVQLNRSGYNTTKADMEAIADSIGTMQTADLVLFLLNTEAMREEKKIGIKIVKNRFTGILGFFTTDVDFSKMQFGERAINEDIKNDVDSLLSSENSIKKVEGIKIDNKESIIDEEIEDLLKL